MKHVFWLVKGEICGRSGPNLDPWVANELASDGIGAVLSVNEGECVLPNELSSAGMAYACIPLSPNAPPIEGDLELCLERLPRAYGFASDQIASGNTVLVHCRQGKDRTGLFMAYYLVRRYGLMPVEAIARVKRVRPIALTAAGWDSHALAVLKRC